MNRWFFRQKRVCHKTSHPINHKIAAASMPGMLNLTDVLQKVDRLDHSAIPQQKPVCKAQIPGFLAFFFCFVISSTPLSRSSSNSFLYAYPLSANSFPNSFFVKPSITFRLRSSTLAGIRQKRRSSPRSLTAR